jgi:hypothetical protein
MIQFSPFLASFEDPIINIQCGQVSLLRTTGLVSPAVTRPMPTTCTYRINVINFQVCQMRLDFRTFSMAPPTADAATPYQRCNTDYLQVGNVTLCGENAGQHGEEILAAHESGFRSISSCSLHSDQPEARRASTHSHSQHSKWKWPDTSDLEHCGSPARVSVWPGEVTQRCRWRRECSDRAITKPAALHLGLACSGWMSAVLRTAHGPNRELQLRQRQGAVPR